MSANISISAFATPKYEDIGPPRLVPEWQMTGITYGCAKALQELGELTGCIEVITVRAAFNTTYTENHFVIRAILNLDSEKVESYSVISLNDFDDKPKATATDSKRLAEEICHELVCRVRAYTKSHLDKKLTHYRELKRRLLP